MGPTPQALVRTNLYGVLSFGKDLREIPQWMPTTGAVLSFRRVGAQECAPRESAQRRNDPPLSSSCWPENPVRDFRPFSFPSSQARPPGSS
jgi:hypothetical protein